MTCLRILLHPPFQDRVLSHRRIHTQQSLGNGSLIFTYSVYSWVERITVIVKFGKTHIRFHPCEFHYSQHSNQVALAGGFVSFFIMFYSSWIGCQSTTGYPAFHWISLTIHRYSTYLYSWVERGTGRVKCLAQEHNTMTQSQVSKLYFST